MTNRSSGRQRISPIQFNFDKQHGYTKVKGIYYRMIRNLQLSGGYQYLQYIHAFLMDPELGFIENIMPQMMGKLPQILNIYNRYPGNPTLTEAITGIYKAEFMQATKQDTNEL